MFNKIWRKIVRRLNKIFFWLADMFGSRYHYISIFDYVLKYPNKAKFLSLGMEDGLYAIAKCYQSNGLYEFDAGLIKKDISLFDWLVILQDVTCYNDIDVILTSDGHALHEIKDYTAISKFGDYSYRLVCDKEEYCKVHKKKVIEEIEEAFLLDGLWSWNWYHFVMQVLPKIKYLNSIPKHVPLLVGWHVDGDNNFHTILNLFLEKLGDINRRIIFLSDQCAYKVQRLYVASLQGLLVPDVKKSVFGVCPKWCLYKKSTITFLRETLLPLMDTKKTYPKNIYITRKNASGRRKFNEEEIVELMISKGFSIVAPEEYSVVEQVALFNNAKNIVACSGAALTNLVYCEKKCKIIIINNYTSTLGIFNTIASIVGSESMSVSGFDFEMGKENDAQDAFTIDPSKLINAMKQLEMI